MTSIPKLIVRYRTCMRRHRTAAEIFVDRYAETETVLGECPESGQPNLDWWDAYRKTKAWAAEKRMEDILTIADHALNTIGEKIPTASPQELGAVLSMLLDHPELLDSIADDPFFIRIIADRLEGVPGRSGSYRFEAGTEEVRTGRKKRSASKASGEVTGRYLAETIENQPSSS